VLGIPMGGHLSKIMISILLASMESNAFSDRRWLIENGFYLPVFLKRRMHPSVLFNGLRHVDDALIFSRVYCTDCLTILMHAIYRAPLQFSVESLPPVCEFLDTDVIAVDNRLRLLIRQKNQEWAAGTSDTIQKFGLPPVLGVPVIARRRVAAFISVKLHRVHQLHPPGDDFRIRALVIIVQELIRLGYTPKFLTRAANSIHNRKIEDLAALIGPVASSLSPLVP
jgi:hypothetical protein